MMRTRLCCMLAGIFFLAMSCSSREDAVERIDGMELTAVLEKAASTRTQFSEPVDGVYYPLWSADDVIALFPSGSEAPLPFYLIRGAGTDTASFRGAPCQGPFVALYPHEMADSLVGNRLYLSLPDRQEMKRNTSVGEESFPMISVSEDQTLAFRNLCAVLKVSFTGNYGIESIKFRPNDPSTPVSGKACVSLDGDPLEPRLVMLEGGSHELTLDCHGCWVYNEIPTDFLMTVPAQTYRGGFTLEIETTLGTVTRSTDQDVTFRRSELRAVPSFNCFEPETPEGSVITYTSFDGQIIEIYSADLFDAPIVSNTYENGLGRIQFEGTLTRLNDGAFNRRAYLTGITLPESVSSIGSNAFASCSRLTRVELLSSTPPELGETVFESTNLYPFFVPSSSVYRYRMAPGWSGYAYRIFSPEEETHPFNPPGEAVDLGLSVKWASCNLYSSLLDLKRTALAWGETSIKSRYDWASYQWCQGSGTTLTRYCNDAGKGADGYTDQRLILDPEDDAASVVWGGGWRMPTIDEWNELKDAPHLFWDYVIRDGIEYFYVYSRLTGNSIYLPLMPGYLVPSAYFWSSSLNEPDCSQAWAIGIYRLSNGDGSFEVRRFAGPAERYRCDFMIRPVKE